MSDFKSMSKAWRRDGMVPVRIGAISAHTGSGHRSKEAEAPSCIHLPYDDFIGQMRVVEQVIASLDEPKWLDHLRRPSTVAFYAAIKRARGEHQLARAAAQSPSLDDVSTSAADEQGETK